MQPPGVLSGIDRARLTPEDYQLVPLIRAFRRPLQRLLIADDVGLGKTVEAILVMLELKARLRGERVLIVAPAGLQDQWSDELVEKIGLAFEIFDSERIREIQQQHQRGENPWMLRRHVITSIDYVKRPDVRRRLHDVRWDLVILDEAHYLAETSSAGKRYRTARSRFGEFIARQTDSLILLTATPHTGDPQSLFSLVQLVDDRLVATPKEMTRERIAPIVIRRYKGDIRDPHEAAQSRFPGIKVQTVDVPFASAAERDLYARIDRYTKRQWKRAGADSAVGFAMTVIKKRSISSRTALLNTLERRLSTLLDQPVDLRVAKQGLLADYRAGVPLTEQQQAAAEDQVLCAPPVEAEERNQERRELERLIATAKALPEEEEGKAQRLVRELQDLTSGKATGRREKVIVFTEFRDTHAFLERYLSVRGFEGRIATLTGLHTRQQRTRRAGSYYPLELLQALSVVWLFAGLRSDEIVRLRIGCARREITLLSTPEAHERCWMLEVPIHKTGTAFAKPIDPIVGEAISKWEAVRPKQPLYLDQKTGELVDLLFAYRARPVPRAYLNRRLIPVLCKKAGIPRSDARGRISSHRARSTIASQLFNTREPMTLFELQAWLGHRSPVTTQHYVAFTPTRLARSYTDAQYFQRNLRMMHVLVDQQAIKEGVARTGEPWRYYDLGHGLCSYEFFDQCPHRMACARCDFYLPKDSSRADLLASKEGMLRMIQEIPLTDDERAAVDGDLEALDRLLERLAATPTSDRAPLHEP